MNWNTVIDGIQNLMIFILILVVAVCILALISFDIITGTGIMMYLTNNDFKQSLLISLATSGLLLALMFVGYTMTQGRKGNLVRYAGIGILIGAGLIYILDVYFDSLTADYLRFGQIVQLKTLPAGDVQILFRVLIGGISTVGETLAIAIIVGMPVLKGVLSDVLPKMESKRPEHKPFVPDRSKYEPKHRPKFKFDPERSKRLLDEVLHEHDDGSFG